MKRILMCLFIVIVSKMCFARGAEIRDVSPLLTVSVSSWTWTALPSTDSIDDERIAVMLGIPTSVSDNFIIYMTNSETPPSAAVTVGYTFNAGDPPWILPISARVYLWGVNTGTASQNLYIQQLKGSF